MVFTTMAALAGRGEPVPTQELERLSHILRRIEATEKLRKDRERAAEKEKAENEKADRPEPRKGLSPEAVAIIRAEVEGRRPPWESQPRRKCTTAPVDPWDPESFPAVRDNPGESHSIPPNPGESHSRSLDPRESWEEIAPRVYRTSPTSILSLGPERAPDAG